MIIFNLIMETVYLEGVFNQASIY